MAQLTAYQLNEYDCDYSQLFNTIPVLTAVTIYKGSAVGSSGGYGRQLVAGDAFLGFAEETSVGDPSTSGAVTCGVRSQGAITAAITSAAVTDIGRLVYMSDGATFTFSSSGNTLIGKVLRWGSTGFVTVAFSANYGIS